MISYRQSHAFSLAQQTLQTAHNKTDFANRFRLNPRSKHGHCKNVGADFAKWQVQLTCTYLETDLHLL
jgi:hypothetical protein